MSKNSERINLNWFGFELNHSQSILLLILAFIGGLNIPFGILIGVDELLVAIILSQPFGNYKQSIIIIMGNVVIFYLCVYTIRRILKPKQNSTFKRKISQDHINHWFGFRINQSQSIFLFTLSLMGLIAITSSYFHGLESFYLGFFFMDLYSLMIYISPLGNLVLQNYAFNIVHLVIFLICLYTLYKMIYGKTSLSGEGTNKTYHLVLFVLFLVIFIILLPRIIFHVILFTPLGAQIGITTYGIWIPPGLQFTDFVILTVVGFICTHSISYLLRRLPDSKETEKIFRFRSPKFLIVSLSISSLIFLIVFSQSLIAIFSRNSTILGFYSLYQPDLFILLLILILFLIMFKYTIKTDKMEEYLKDFEPVINKKWLGCIIRRKSYAIILVWISIAQLVNLLQTIYLLYPLIDITMFAESIKILSLYIFMGLEAFFCIFNIINLYTTQKK